MSEQAGQVCGPGGSWQWKRRVQAGSGGRSRLSAGLRPDWSGQDRLRAGWERPMQGRRPILVSPQEQPRGWLRGGGALGRAGLHGGLGPGERAGGWGSPV